MNLTEASLEPLLAETIDYAGLFPPAGQSMARAVADFHDYRHSADRWALGRFVAPATRAGELLDELERLGDARGWRISLTLGAPAEALPAIQSPLAARADGLGAAIDSFEVKVDSPDAVSAMARALGGRSVWYGEVPLGSPARDAVLDALTRHGGRAKLRLGGVLADAFPEPDAVALAVQEVVGRGLSFKATAGLHHPIRGRYRLTYAPDAPSVSMYGYLNLMVAIVTAQAGGGRHEVVAALLDPDASSLLRIGEGRGHQSPVLTQDAIARLRSQFDSFGSCSFREPIDELEPALSR